MSNERLTKLLAVADKAAEKIRHPDDCDCVAQFNKHFRPATCAELVRELMQLADAEQGRDAAREMVTLITTEKQKAELNREEVAKQLDHAAWKGFNQSDSDFEKGYKHAMEVAAQTVRASTTKAEG